MPYPARVSIDPATLRHTRWGLVVGTKLGTVENGTCHHCLPDQKNDGYDTNLRWIS
jgi:hypothetical protein